LTSARLAADRHPGDQPALAIDIAHVHRDLFAERQVRGDLLRPFAEVLALLRAVDTSSRTRTARPSSITE